MLGERSVVFSEVRAFDEARPRVEISTRDKHSSATGFQSQQGIESRTKNGAHFPLRKHVRFQGGFEHERGKNSPERFSGRARGNAEQSGQRPPHAIANARVDVTKSSSDLGMAADEELDLEDE
jgi:hypothetical protein